MEFVIGQRWVSQAEPQLGLGIIVETDGRQVTVMFPAAEEDRIYAASSAPLARIIYRPGDHCIDLDQQEWLVKAVEDMNGLQYYLVEDSEGGEHLLPETKISGTIELHSPTQRLYSGQFGRNKTFKLRAASLHFRYQTQNSSVRGLLGSRTNLLPHQIYIANEVASRFAPRVLLADEVGLGKTIESGMILHHQLYTGLASRALIIVPSALLHQWLVEMLRRFNLHFSLFDEARYNAILESGEANPFETEQLILCSLDLLSKDDQIAQQALAASWDLLIVDEAHHLSWSPDSPSPEYQLMEQFAARTAGLLLLTATPEQLGLESHFARLRLLDPARFHDLSAFVDEQSRFAELNEIVSALQENEALNAEQLAQLDSLLAEHGETTSAQQLSGELDHRNELIARLLDRHGTGRVLFRNTRAAMPHFPKRVAKGYALPAPAAYLDNANQQPLYPERHLQQLNEDWISVDPRVSWLEDLLKQLRPQKVLLICSSAATAIDLERHLHLDAGIRSAAFYEDLSIVERDRAAAYFADEESGAQTLICSEIGSEGRNFQFAQHLVLFDLPTNPDLLEQRIGRLDRIGQTADIQIHIPYLQNSAQENLYLWYRDGLNAFGASFSGGLAVYREFEARLTPHIHCAPTADRTPENEEFKTLLDDTRQFADALRETLHSGRDRLLELNSCNQEIAETVIEQIVESERSELLQSYMTMLFDVFGVDHDFHSEHSLVLKPTDHMLSGYFPGLREEGTTITFDRAKAQIREDMQFVTWENPMVVEAMEMVLGTELGNTAIAATKLKSIPAGTVMLEAFFVVHCTAPQDLQLERFLPALPIRVLIDNSGNNLTETIKHAQMNKLCSHVKKSNRLAIVKQIRNELEKMVDNAQIQAKQQAAPVIQAAEETLNHSLTTEIERLVELKRLNGAIREEEIEFLQQQKDLSLALLDNASVNLEAVRVIINT